MATEEQVFGDGVSAPVTAEGTVEPGRNAYDDTRSPPMELIDDCVHCGFCLPTCPTYTLWGDEMDSPRGRIVIMKSGHEEGAELTRTKVKHIDQCIGCMSCVTACPSGVQYDKLIEDMRGQIERNFDRTPQETAYRRMLFETFPYPGRLRAMAPLLRVYHKTGAGRLVGRSGVLKRFPRLRQLEELSPDVPLRASWRRLPATVRPQGEPRARVGMLEGCVQRVFFSDVNIATAKVLQAEGFEVMIPRNHRCCGALQIHTGVAAEATELAKETIEAFEDCDYVAINAAGCGSSMKDYAHLLREDPEWHERAERFAAKCRDVSELLTEFEPIAERHPVPVKLAYHDACHLAHAQGVRAQPRKLLRDIPGLEVVDPAEWELCCGSGGVWNLLNPEPAMELGRRKAENLLATGAEAIAAANPGCTLQISSALDALERPLPIYHPIELLRMSIEGTAQSGPPLARATAAGNGATRE